MGEAGQEEGGQGLSGHQPEAREACTPTPKRRPRFPSPFRPSFIHPTNIHWAPMMFHAQAQPWEWAWPAEPAPFRHVTWRVLVPWVGQTLLCQGTALASPSPQERLGVLCLPSPLPQTELPIHVDLKETRNLRSHRQCSSETILPREAPAEAADRSPKSQPRCCSESLGAWRRRAGVWTPGLGTLGPAAPTPTAGEGMAGLLRPQDPQGCLRERGWGGGGVGAGRKAGESSTNAWKDI